MRIEDREGGIMLVACGECERMTVVLYSERVVDGSWGEGCALMLELEALWPVIQVE